MGTLYEITVDGEDAVVVTADALLETWGSTAPDGVSKAFDLGVGDVATVMRQPLVQVRRLR